MECNKVYLNLGSTIEYNMESEVSRKWNVVKFLRAIIRLDTE
jgi:hypothetical protein